MAENLVSNSFPPGVNDFPSLLQLARHETGEASPRKQNVLAQIQSEAGCSWRKGTASIFVASGFRAMEIVVTKISQDEARLEAGFKAI